MQRYYFDHNATTPVSPEVLAAMIPAMSEAYGNASSIHYHGQEARALLDNARREVAEILNADPRGIVFTSGGTEGDNLAVFGVARARMRTGAPHVITSTIEHSAVLQSCHRLESEGVEVTYARVGKSGVIDPDEVRAALRPNTALVSVMHANNELGTVQPIAEIAAIAHEAGALMHSDGVQAAGKIPLDVQALGVDLYSISGHKIYAPKGVGALWLRDGLDLIPLQYGGRHENGRRAGTENVPGAVAIGRAAQWLHKESQPETLRTLRDRLEAAVLDRIPDVQINCAASPRVPNTSNMLFDGVDSEPLLISLDLRGFAVSSGSACSSGATEPSHVLTAIGLTKLEARSCLRISLGRSNTAEQVDTLVDALAACAGTLRKLSVHA